MSVTSMAPLWAAALLLYGCDPMPVDTACSVYDQVYVFQDADEDGFGSAEGLGYVCEVGPGEATNRADCDDTNPLVNPGAEELCDFLDNNCNDIVDEEHEKVPWYPDRDGDAFGATAGGVFACRAPGPEYTRTTGDCDDDDPTMSPTTPEVCNQVDDDCDGRVDDLDSGLVPQSRMAWYQDRDEDGYGDPFAVAQRCVPPTGFVENDLDCDDRDPEVSPDADLEYCDFVDNDCDGFVDDFDPDTPLDEDALREFACDRDGDGYGDPEQTCLACRPTVGIAVDNRRDVDDQDPLANIPQSWFADVDGDGVGAGDEVVFQAENPNKVEPPPDPPLAPASKGIDCAPEDPTISPSALEICADSIDQDCSGADCASCAEWHAWDPTLPSGVYDIDTGNFDYVKLYCDMVTDGGGWTVVASTFESTLNDEASPYYDDLQSLFPGGSHTGVYDGLRDTLSEVHDMRFACKKNLGDPAMTVDLSFYEVPWYHTITTGSDADSDFSCCAGRSDLEPPPARRNNVTGVNKRKGDQWSAGYLEGEGSAFDTNDFTVDFDDRGMNSDQTDGTDWGEDDGTKKCGTQQTPSFLSDDEVWVIFVR